MSKKIIHVCDVCRSEENKVKTFYVDRGRELHESNEGMDPEDYYTVDVCDKCILRWVNERLKKSQMI